MNLGLSDLQKSEFLNFNLVARPIIYNTEIPNPNWIAGLLCRPVVRGAF